MRQTCLIISMLVVGMLASLPALAGETFEFVSPRPGAKYVSAETVLILRPGGPLTAYLFDERNIWSVRGERSGLHRGKIVFSDDGETLIFEPHRPFHPGERVTVTIASFRTRRSEQERGPVTYDFTVARRKSDFTMEKRIQQEFGPMKAAGRPEVSGGSTGRSVADAPFELPEDFPEITVPFSDQPDTGFVFLGNLTFGGEPPNTPYLMILNNDGFPEFFRRMPQSCFDFKLQPTGVLTYFVGTKFYAMDNTYTVIDSFEVVNGYSTDLHEFHLLPNGHIVMLGLEDATVDMSEIVTGGDTAATVLGAVIQEFDASRNLIFEWRSLDPGQIPVTDSPHLDLTANFIDYVHANAIEIDQDGHFLLSSRHLDEITKIDRDSSKIIWRLGGTQNEFEFVNDSTGFNYQHAIRRQANGNITLFDNGVLHEPSRSRAVEYELDEENRIATLVWEYRNDPDIYGFAMGYAQRLPNDNTLIGWGNTNPTLTEARPDGSRAFELTLPQDVYSYRAYRFPWEGTAATPYAWADTAASDSVDLHFTRFGADNTVKFYIYQGEFPSELALLDSTSESTITIKELTEGQTYYFRVTALDDQGNETGFSNLLSIDIDQTSSVAEEPGLLPDEFVVHDNYPNPFNPSTTISYGLPMDARVEVSIYNVRGQRVRQLLERDQTAGFQSVMWDGRNDAGRPVPSGVYLYRIVAGEFRASKKMLLLK